MKVGKGLIKYLAFAIITVLIIVFSRSVERTALLSDDNTEFVKAEVISVNGEYVIDETTGVGDNQNITVEIKSGQYKGETITCTAMTGYLYGANCKVGTKVILRVAEYNGKLSASVYNYDREGSLLGLVIVFLALMWLVGGKKGLNSILALVFTFIAVIYWYIPMMYIGISPFIAAVYTVILVTIMTHILIADFSIKSISAMIGTISGVIFAGIIAYLFGLSAHISGYNVADIETLVYIGNNSKLEIGGMLFSGIIIASLGAVMDVAMSISSALSELKINKPEMEFKELFHSGMNIGKDMIGTMSNTLILAYVGSSINLLMIIYAYIYPVHQILNMYDLAIQVMSGLSGTMGIILTVPLTSLITALIYSTADRQN